MRILHLLLEAILVIVTVLFLLEYKDRILEKMLQKEGIEATIEFVDLHCIQLEKIRYKNLPIAQKALVCIRYAPLLQGRVEFSEAILKGLELNSIQQLAANTSGSGSKSSFSIPMHIQELHVDAKYYYKGLNRATLIAQDISPQRAKILKLTVKSFAGRASAKGKYDGELTLLGTLYPDPSFVKKKLPQINPKALKKANFTLKANKKTLIYTLKTKALRLLHDLNATLTSEGSYFYAQKRYFSRNRLFIDVNKSHIISDLNVSYQNALHYTACGSIINEKYNIPVKASFYEHITFFLKGDPTTLQSTLKNAHFHAAIGVKKWKKFEIRTSPITLGSLLEVPNRLQNKKFVLNALYDGTLQAKLGGDLGQASISYQKNLLKAIVKPKDFEEFHFSRLAPVKLQADLKSKEATITSPLFRAKTVFTKGVHATLLLGKSRFSLMYEQNLSLQAKIPSLKALATKLSTIYPLDIGQLDAKLNVKATYDPKTKRYVFALRSPKVSKGLKKLKYLEIKGHGEKESLWIDYYAIAFANHAFYATKPSNILFSKGVIVKSFWIEDSLLLQGFYKNEHGRFSLKSDRYHYSSVEGSIDTKVDLLASITQKRVYVEGNLLLLQGDISFEPKRAKNVEDPDIIVVDAPKKESPPFFKENVALNIKIDTKKTIRYHIPDLQIFFKPDLLVWKEYGKDLELLGFINILKGSYKPLGEEYFIKKSNIYFYSKPTDPFLELHIKTKKESYTIYITVSGSLSNPILTFDSDPYLPQKDILTLLLLGSKSSNLLFKAVGGNQLAGALGSMFLKNMLSSLGLKLDTLTFSAGSRLGFEIGKRISDKITVLYKNDQVSTIIVRYQINDHFESEAIFGPQKSGINIFYRKVR